jgi:hypothetical protein
MRGAMTGGLRAHGGEEAQHKCGNSKPRTGRYGARATEDLCSRFILNHRDSSLALMMTNKQTFSSALLKNKSALLAVQRAAFRRVDHSPGTAAMGL